MKGNGEAQHKRLTDHAGVPYAAVMVCEEGCEGPEGRNATAARAAAKTAGWARSYTGYHEIWRCPTHRRVPR